MKKSRCLVFFFYLVTVTVCVSAQEVTVGKGTLTFGGKVASGVFFDSDDIPLIGSDDKAIAQNADFGYGSKGTAYLWNETDAKKKLRSELTATYTMDNIGFRVRFRADDDIWTAAQPGNNVIGRYAYGWINLLGDSIKLTGGWIDLSENVWGTLGDGDWDIGGNGLRVELKPLKIVNKFINKGEMLGDLNIGAFLWIPNENKSPPRWDDRDGKWLGTGNVTLERVFKESVFGFRYTHPWFYLGAQMKLDSDIDGYDIYFGGSKTPPSYPPPQSVAPDDIWSWSDEELQFMFGMGFTMLPELVFSVEGNFEGMGNWQARGIGDLRQTLSYSFTKIPVPWLDRLTLGVKAQELLWGFDIWDNYFALGDPGRTNQDGFEKTLSPWVQVKPFVRYKIFDFFSAGFEMGFGGGHYLNKTDPAVIQSSLVNEKSNFFFKPKLELNLPGGLEIIAWYMFTKIDYTDLWENYEYRNRNGSRLPKDDNGTLAQYLESISRNQIALEFVWKF